MFTNKLNLINNLLINKRLFCRYLSFGELCILAPRLEYILLGGDFMLEFINSLLCGAVLPIALCVVGIFFLIRLDFFFIRHPISTLRTVVRSSGGFRSLCVALAGTLGVGNIVGVASAIIMGGAGAVLWLIVSAIVAMGIKYAEAYLAISHRRNGKGGYYGGAPYYIYDSCKDKRKGRIFGAIFAILCVANSLTTGNLVQINSVSDFLTQGRLFSGILFTVAVFFVIKGGKNRIEAVSAVIIPLLSIGYILVSLYIIFSNYDALCVVFSRILSQALSFKGALGGVCGFGIGEGLRYGFSRGLLSNEAGCGTAPVAHATSSLDAHSQGCLGIFEVFWDTVVLCTLTALVILIADTGEDSPILLAVSSYGKFTGRAGEIFICACCVLFALATVACQYYYGAMSLEFLCKSRVARGVYLAIFLTVCVISSIISNSTMWQIADFIIAFLALYNIIFLVILSSET